MRIIFLILFTGFLFNNSELRAQEGQNLKGFSEIEINSGHPTIYTGKKGGFDFENPEYGVMNSGSAFLGSYLLVDNSSPKNPRYWYWIIKKDSTSTLGGLSFDENKSNFKAAKMNLINNPEANFTYPIEIVYNEIENQFYYKWIGSDENNIPKAAKNDSKLTTGSKMPGFTVQLLSGKSFSFNNLKNKIMVINWWSTTCGPCIAEIPGLNKLVEKYKSNDNIVFLAIAWDSKQKLNSFLQNKPFEYQQALYNDQTIQLFGGAFPRNLVVNKNGNIAYNELGAAEDQWERIDQVIQLVISADKE